MKPWTEFNRFQTGASLPFYGCLDKDGVWFDSSLQFELAVHWVIMNEYGYSDMTMEEEIRWMSNKGVELGYSIVHSDMIKKMYEAGMIK